MSVKFQGFHGHLVICKNNFFVNPQKILLGESTKISAVQLHVQPFLHNDTFLLKHHLIAYYVMALLKYVLLYLKQQKDHKISFFSL